MAQPGNNKQSSGSQGETQRDESKTADVRMSNIIAAKAVADAIRTSLGPRGMDKMIQAEKGDVLITNDGATILGQIQVLHPAARMLVELSKAQDIEAGDGTTSVVVIAGALLDACTKLLGKGIHSTTIADGFLLCAKEAIEVLNSISIHVDSTDREQLLAAATTSLCSKVVSNDSHILAPMAVDAVLRVSDLKSRQVDLRDIHIVKILGGTIENSELVEGIVFPKPSETSLAGIKRVQNAKIALIQFHLSAPKTNIDNKVIINDYAQMDRILTEERKYILEMCKKIKKSGCNVVLVQKSILRDATNEMSIHFLSKMKIMVICDVERDQVDFISRTLGCRPVAHVDSLTPDKLGSADLVEEVDLEGKKITKITGVQNSGKTVTLLLRGSNNLVLDESDRSLHDALCVIRCLVREPSLIAGGGAPESEIFAHFQSWMNTLNGADRHIAKAFAEALEIIPYTLAENAGLHPISIVTQLRQKHQRPLVQKQESACDDDNETRNIGIDVKMGCLSNMRVLNVLQPLLVSKSALNQASEYVHMMLKIDDMVATMRQ